MTALRFGVLCLGVLAAAACVREPPQPPQLPDSTCFPPGHHFAFIGTDTGLYRQGAEIRVTPRVNMAPAGTPDLPLHCVADWSVTGPATLSADRTTLRIAPDAPIGSIVVVSARHGDDPLALRLRVIGRDEVVLTGRRSQQAVEGCSIPDPIGELEFHGENRFSVTFRPFETYRDYWGTYAFDPATGALRLTVERGNFVPPGLDLEGRAELASGRLVLRDMFLGSREALPPAGSCTYRF